MGEVVQASDLTPDVVVIEIHGPLGADTQRLLDAIDQAMANRATWGKIFIADLSQASSLEESDVKILNDAQSRIRRSGGVLGVVDPYRRLPEQANELLLFNSIDDAISKYANDIIPIDVQIYLSDESAAQEVQFAVEALLDRIGIGNLQGEQAEFSSWYRRFRGWTTRAGASQAGEDFTTAMDAMLVQRHQADIDAAIAGIIETLAGALEKTPSAVIQAGSTIFVKYEHRVFSCQLTEGQMKRWKDDPDLFKDPRRALSELQRAASETTGDLSSGPSSLSQGI